MSPRSDVSGPLKEETIETHRFQYGSSGSRSPAVRPTHRWSKPDSNPRSHFSDPSFLIEIPGSRETPKREIALMVEARDVLLKRLDLGPRLDDSDELYGIFFRANFYVAEAIDESLDEAPLPDGALLHAGEV